MEKVNSKEIVDYTSILYIGEGLILVFSLLYAVIIPRLLGPDIYAVFVYFVAIITTITTFSSFGLGGFLTRFIPEYLVKKEYSKLKPLLKVFIKLRLLFSLIAIVIAAVLILLFTDTYTILFFITIPISLILAMNILILNALYGLKEIRKFKFLDFLNVLLKVIFVPVLFLVFHIAGALFAFLPIYILTTFFGIIWINRKLTDKTNEQLSFQISFKEIFRFTIPNFIAYIFSSFYLPALIFIVGYFMGIGKDISYIFLAITLTLTIMPFLKILKTATFPTLVELYSKKNETDLTKLLNHVIRYSSLISLLIVPLVFLIGTNLIILVFGEEYSPVAPLWNITIIALIFIGVGEQYKVLAQIYKKTEIEQIFGMIYFFSAILISFYFLPRFGTVIISYSFLISNVIAFIFAIVSLIYISKIKIEFLNLVKIGFASSIAFIVSKTIVALINWIFVGFIFILIYFGVLFLIKGIYKADVYLIRSMFYKKK